MNKDWTDRLRERMANYEVGAGSDLWTDIEARLDDALRDNASPSAKERMGHIIPIWRWVAAAVVALLVVGGSFVWFHLSQKQVFVQNISHKQGLAQQKKNMPSTPNRVEQPVTVSLLHVPCHTNIALVDTTKNDSLVVSPEHGDFHLSVTADASSPDSPHNDDSSPGMVPVHEEFPPVSHSRRISLSLYAMNSLGNNQSTSLPVIVDAQLSKQDVNDSGDFNTLFSNGFQEKKKHKIPLSYGLSVAVDLTNSMALQTGLVYTYVESEFFKSMLGNTFLTHQTLHYVGIPLQLRYNVWHWKDVKVYALAGGQLDMNVKARQQTEGVDVEMKRDRLQGSLMAHWGVQYEIVPPFAVYGEMGARWYPDNGSHVDNYFKDKPLGLSAQLGLRLTY